MRTTLRKALRDAEKAGIINKNPVQLSEPVKVDRRVRHFLDLDEAQCLLATASGDRLEALYVLLLSLGLRRGEALALRWDDIDLDAGTVSIHSSLAREQQPPLADGTYPEGRKTRLVVARPKTEDSYRTQHLPGPCIAALLRHKAVQAEERLDAPLWADEGLVFTTPIGTHLDPANVAKAFSQLCKKAGLGHRNLHQLRHSAATIMLAQGIPLQEVSQVLGHSTISVTADVYGHLVAARRKAAAEAMGDALWGAPAGP